MSPDRVFVDTNILVYAYDPTDPIRHGVALDVVAACWAGRTGAISTQVLQEFYSVVTRKLEPPMSRLAAREIVALYGTWPLVQVDLPLIVAASALEEEHALSFWDALVVEAARRIGASRLLTEDLQDAREIGGVRIENPFR